MRNSFVGVVGSLLVMGCTAASPQRMVTAVTMAASAAPAEPAAPVAPPSVDVVLAAPLAEQVETRIRQIIAALGADDGRAAAARLLDLSNWVRAESQHQAPELEGLHGWLQDKEALFAAAAAGGGTRPWLKAFYRRFPEPPVAPTEGGERVLAALNGHLKRVLVPAHAGAHTPAERRVLAAQLFAVLHVSPEDRDAWKVVARQPGVAHELCVQLAE